MKTVFLIFSFIIGISTAFANNPGVSYQGRIFKPDGNPLEGATVQFRMQVRSPGSENCLLYEEVQTINMAGSSGIFAITMNDGSGSRLDTPTYQVDRIFANRDTMALDSTRCAVGTTYAPNSGDGRKFIVYFKDETMTTYEPLPIMSLNYAPQAMYALEAQKLGPFAVSNVLRAVDVSGNPVTAPALDPTQLTNLTNLLTSGSAAPAYSAITGATATNTIDNTNFSQIWNWSTATTQSPMVMAANSLTTGSIMNVTTSSGSLNSTNGLLNVANTGASTNGILARFQSNSTAGSGLTVLTNGNVGIGTTTPPTKLEVSGTIKVGDGGESCAVGTKGSIRYNNASSVLEFCNGASWNLVQAAACSDATPAVFSLSDQANATASTLYTSNIVQVTGINCSVPVTVSGAGSPQFQICSDGACGSVLQGWTSSPSSITTGQYIQTRLTTDSVGGAMFQATVIVGSGATVWSVTNAGGDCTLSPSIGTVCADGTIYAGLSPDGSVKMFTQRCDLGQTWSGVACTGSRTGLSWNNGTGNWTTTGFTSALTGKSNSAAIAALVDAGSPHAAATNCENLNENGKTDWYLPSLNELNVLYNNKAAVRNFDTSGNVYWSSTETSYSNAYYERFSDGSQNYDTKNNGYYVRCVRR